MRLGVPDLISPSYFPAIAAVELGFMRDEGLDVSLELLYPVTTAAHELRAGQLDFLAGSAHAPLYAFPAWDGARLACALSQNMYWFLVVRSDLALQAGDIEGLRGLRIAAAPGPDLGLKALLAAHGVDPEAAGLQIAPPAAAPADHSFGVAAAHALAAGQVDGFWANGMGAEVAVRSGTGRVIADARRDGGPAALFTFPALMTTEQLIATEPAAVGAAVRAVMAAQQCLRESPAVAAEIGKRLFPPAEAALIADLVARDADYYSPAISPETVRALNDFACSARLLTGPVSYEQVVAAEFVPLWETARGVAGR